MISTLEKAIDCKNWPLWLHEIVDVVTENDSDLSTEQAIALGILEFKKRHAITDETVNKFEAAFYGRHERGFIMRPLIDAPDFRAALIEVFESENI